MGSCPCLEFKKVSTNELEVNIEVHGEQLIAKLVGEVAKSEPKVLVALTEPLIDIGLECIDLLKLFTLEEGRSSSNSKVSSQLSISILVLTDGVN